MIRAEGFCGSIYTSMDETIHLHSSHTCSATFVETHEKPQYMNTRRGIKCLFWTLMWRLRYRQERSRAIRALLVGKGLILTINVKMKSASGWCVVETQQGRFTEVG